MHTKLKSQIRLIRWMIRRVRLLEIRKHTCRVSVIEISYTYRCIYKQININWAIRVIKFMEINLSKKKKWILRIICICVLLQLPVVYFMDKFYYFNDDNIRYTIGTYYKEGVIVNSSSNKEKGFIYYVDSIKYVATTGKFNNTDISHTHVLIMFSAVFHGNAKVLSIIVPKWVLAPPKAGWEQFPPDINWKGAELDTAYMKKMNLEIP